MDTRREFIKKAGLLTGGTGLMNILPASIAKALAINPAAGSTFMDAEHIVFLMQENRSFDHTYGTLQGVRGFNDPRAIRLPNNNPVWLQTNKAGETFVPFRFDIKKTKVTWMHSLPHSWSDQVDARNNGNYDKWLDSKASGHKEYKEMPLTMGFYSREDIPFYYSLADAFTVCDHNFCSSLTGTTPNRLYFWSGTIREKQEAKSIANVWNDDADYDTMVNWKTFPERLEENDISWKVYQNELSIGVGFDDEEDGWLANFTDNPLEFFTQYQVKLSAEYIAYLPKAAFKISEEIKKRERQLAALPAGAKEEDNLKKELEGLKKKLALNAEDQKNYTKAKYDQLSQQEKNIHDKAFSTNRKDPFYHELTTLQYKDGETTREVKIPKGDILHEFREDAKNKTLPTVSWLVAPANFSDHPGSAWYGAWYISEVMDILTRDPETWKKTIFILTYDENDGYFDHVPPFVPPHPNKKNSGLVSAGIDTAVEYVAESSQQTNQHRVRESAIGLGLSRSDGDRFSLEPGRMG
jgi:phospholipase C